MFDVTKQATDLRFELLRNAIYHTARNQFLDKCARYMNFFVIVFGTSAAAQLGSEKWNIDPKWLAAGAALSATFQLVGDFAVSARVHAYLQRRCYELLAELEGTVPLEELKIVALRAKLTTLYGEEPPPLRALDAIAYNAACDSIGKGAERVKIKWWQSLLRQIYPFNGTEFLPTKASASASSAP